MQTPFWFWITFHLGVFAVLAADLFGFHRKAHAPSTRESLLWTLAWVALSLGFNGFVWYQEGAAKGLEFLTGYLIEYSLSIDNIFVFVLLFSFFAVPRQYQHRVLFWGILSALVLRGAMIGLGVQLIERFAWVMYVFGAFLLLTGLKMFFGKKGHVDLGKNPLNRLIHRWLPVTSHYRGDKFFVRLDGRSLLTPLAVVLVMVEATDVLFAVDSIPAIFGVTHDPFIVYTSNICAILGLRSLYFLLAGVVHRFVYLKPGLAIILAFIGAKMLLADLCHVPALVSLAAVGSILAGSIGLSLLATRRNPSTPEAALPPSTL
jgi:tellurite resistance protein TerC